MRWTIQDQKGKPKCFLMTMATEAVEIRISIPSAREIDLQQFCLIGYDNGQSVYHARRPKYFFNFKSRFPTIPLINNRSGGFQQA